MGHGLGRERQSQHKASNSVSSAGAHHRINEPVGLKLVFRCVAVCPVDGACFFTHVNGDIFRYDPVKNRVSLFEAGGMRIDVFGEHAHWGHVICFESIASPLTEMHSPDVVVRSSATILRDSRQQCYTVQVATRPDRSLSDACAAACCYVKHVPCRLARI